MKVTRNKYCVHFFFNDTATTEIYTLSLHDALPIWAKILSTIASDIWSQTLSGCPAETDSEVKIIFYSPIWKSLISINHYWKFSLKIGRAHVWTPVTRSSRMPSSAWKKKYKNYWTFIIQMFLLKLS